MAKTKKAFDREDMYRKIMPSASKAEKEEVLQQFGDNAEKEINEINSERLDRASAQGSAALFQNKEIKWINTGEEDVILYNITERMVMNRLELALKKMNCCRCDRCKKDIVALALNALKPHYAVGQNKDMEAVIAEEDKNGLEVTSAILKAILKIRKAPRH